MTFNTDDLPRLFVMMILAAVLGYIAAIIAGGRIPLGPVGAIGFGLLGAWAASDLLRPHVPFALSTEPQMDGVRLVTAGLGAFTLSLIWCLLTARLTRRRR